LGLEGLTKIFQLVLEGGNYWKVIKVGTFKGTPLFWVNWKGWIKALKGKKVKKDSIIRGLNPWVLPGS